MESNKKRLIEIQSSLPLFFQYNWLNFICGIDNWDVLIYEENNKIIGVYSYYKNRNRITQPNFLIYMGPYILRNSYSNIVLQTIQIKMQKFILKSLDFKYYEQRWHPDFYNHIIFFQNNFCQQTKYTYRLNNLHNLDDIWRGFKGSLRSDIKRASQKLYIENYIDPKLLYNMLNVTFDKSGIQNPYSEEWIIKLIKYLKDNSCGAVYTSKNFEGLITNVIVVIWDNLSMYYVISASRLEFKKLNGNSLLIWEAIKSASVRSLSFDFEGSILEGIEPYFRSFGGELTPYHFIYQDRETNLQKIVNKLKF